VTVDMQVALITTSGTVMVALIAAAAKVIIAWIQRRRS